VAAEVVAVEVAVVAVAQVHKAQLARPLQVEPLLELPEVAELHPLAADKPHLYRHCRQHRLLVELLKAQVLAVGMGPGHQPQLPSNGSFTSKETEKTARERPSTMSPMEKSKISAYTIAPSSAPGFPARRKAHSNLQGSNSRHGRGVRFFDGSGQCSILNSYPSRMGIEH
jgi:hypothetical protein